VLHNGAIATMDARNTMALSVVIRGDRVAAVSMARGIPSHDACATVMDLGSIEAGKLADLVVLSDDVLDPRKVPDVAIKRLHSVMTIVGGKVVYDAARPGGS